MGGRVENDVIFDHRPTLYAGADPESFSEGMQF